MRHTGSAVAKVVVWPAALVLLGGIWIISHQFSGPSVGGLFRPAVSEQVTLSLLKSEALAFLVTRRNTTQIVVRHHESDWSGDWEGVLWATTKWTWGANLQKITEKDLRRDGDVLYCRLPDPELLDFSVEPGSIGFMSKSTALPKLKDVFGVGSQRQKMEERLREQAMQFAREKNMTPSRQEMINQLNAATTALKNAAGFELRFE